MIECTYQVVAVYASGEAQTLAPVLAWGDAGEPFILGPQGLTLASKEAEFQGVRFANAQPQGPIDPTDPAPVVTKPDRRDKENGR